jgi:hypothetical protein
MSDIADGITIALIFLGLSAPIVIIGLVYYLKKRLEHKQIMAAIEKGTHFQDLRYLKHPHQTGPLWISNLAKGVAALIISAGLIGIGFIYCRGKILDGEEVCGWVWFIVALIFFAGGVSRLIRSFLQRKAEKAQPQVQPPNQINAGES